MRSSQKRAAKTPAAPATPDARPVVDFPQQDERITSREYGMRVSTPEGAEEADVSINQGPWQPCRRAVGHWWFDWSGFDPGEHEVIARARGNGGRWLVSTPVEFFVD